MTNALTDSLRRADLDGVLGRAKAAPVAAKVRKVKRYQIMYTTADGNRRASRKLYEYAVARKIVARLNRRAYADAYASALTVTVAS